MNQSAEILRYASGRQREFWAKTKKRILTRTSSPGNSGGVERLDVIPTMSPR